MNKKLLKIEKYLILVPATVILMSGLLYLILVPLGSIPHPESEDFNQKLASLVVFEVLLLPSFAALFSIWTAVDRYLGENIVLKYSTNPYIFAGVVVGIVISMAALFELLFPNHYFKHLMSIQENTAFLSMFIFGLPLCVPAIHLLIASRLEGANQSLGSKMSRSGTL